MKVYIILACTTLWWIQTNAITTSNNYRPGMQGTSMSAMHTPFRRSHHTNKQPDNRSQFRKKWHPHQTHPGRMPPPRRPTSAPASLMVNNPNYVRQRLGLGLGHLANGPPYASPIAAPFPNNNPHPTLPTASHSPPNVHNPHSLMHQSNKPPPPPITKLQPQKQPPQQFKEHHAPPPQPPKMPIKNFNAPPSKVNKWSSPPRNVKPQPAKPFMGSPKLQTEVEYHIQTNQIPNQPIMIKQLDNEKGPIHTIPAPNLSLADKPKQIQLQQLQNTPQQAISHSHFESTTKLNKPFLPTLVTHQYQVTEQPELAQHEKIVQQEPEIPPLKPDLPLHNDQVFSLLPVQDGFGYSVLHQPQLQQHLLQQQQSNAYQTMLVQPQFFQAEPTYLDIQHKQPGTPPEMHTFNYEEPKHNVLQSHVSAQYMLHSGNDEHRNVEKDEDPNNDFFSSVEKDVASSFSHIHEGSSSAVRRPNDRAKFEILNQQRKQQQEEQQRHEMMIYVPDDQDQFDINEELEQYETSDNSHSADNSQRLGYGSRIRPKSSN